MGNGEMVLLQENKILNFMKCNIIPCTYIWLILLLGKYYKEIRKDYKQVNTKKSLRSHWLYNTAKLNILPMKRRCIKYIYL